MEKISSRAKSKNIILLKDVLDDILMDYEFNINYRGEDTLKKLANGEGSINYNNLFFKSSICAISNYDFFKKIWYIV